MPSKSIVRSLLSWFARKARDLPWRRTDDPYAIWVSEIMLQQTQVRTVIPYWTRWMQAFPTIQSLAKASPQRVLKLLEGLGYYTRARNLQRAAKLLWRENAGRFPNDYVEVLALPGIGRYSAGAICSIAFNQPIPVVDGNVARVLTRFFGITQRLGGARVTKRLWKLAEALVREATRAPIAGARRWASLNQALMELGAVVCTPRQPQCETCPVQWRCVANRKGRTRRLPNLPARSTAIPRRVVAFIVGAKSRFLVRQTPPGTVNSCLWEFPNLEADPADGDILRLGEQALGFRPKSLRPVGRLKHSITHYRITLDIYRIDVPKPRKLRPSGGRWLTLGKLHELPFAGAHRKILAWLMRPSVATLVLRPCVRTLGLLGETALWRGPLRSAASAANTSSPLRA
jgi:A/G-specific adenine glycosylase